MSEVGQTRIISLGAACPVSPGADIPSRLPWAAMCPLSAVSNRSKTVSSIRPPRRRWRATEDGIRGRASCDARAPAVEA